MSDTGSQRDKLQHLLESLRDRGGFDLQWTIADPPSAPAAGPAQAAVPALAVELDGPDLPLLLDRNGELLHAIENVAASILRLEPEQAEQLSVDAGGFRAARAAEIEQQAQDAIARVRSSAEPFLFPPMNARERRLLHLALQASGLPTASSGEGPRRFVVLYPEGATPEPDRFAPPPPRRNPSGREGYGRQGFHREGNGNAREGNRSPGGSQREGNRPRRAPEGFRPGRPRPNPAPSAGQPDRRPFGNRRPDNFGNRAEEPAAPELSSQDPAFHTRELREDLPGERRQRPALDPNGNPIETPAPNSDPSVEARLRKLRENFRQR